MAEEEAGEGQGIGRVEAFSDGVIAIIITIMVLELKVPVEDGIDHILSMWHLFLAYALSYIYVGLYWGNHHRLLSHARPVSNSLIWSNLALLFGLSLVPFGTAYLGEHEFSRTATQLYLVTLILPALGYVWLQRVVARTGARHDRALDYHLRTTRKGYFAMAVYAAGFALTFVSPWLGSVARRWSRSSGLCLKPRLIGFLGIGARQRHPTGVTGNTMTLAYGLLLRLTRP